MADPTRPLEPAEIVKLEAEAEAARATAETRREEARKYHAEAERLEEDTRGAAVTRGLSEIQQRELARQEERSLVSDYYKHTYFFGEPVGSQSTRRCMATLIEWSRLEPACPIEIIFS